MTYTTGLRPIHELGKHYYYHYYCYYCYCRWAGDGGIGGDLGGGL